MPSFNHLTRGFEKKLKDPGIKREYKAKLTLKKTKLRVSTIPEYMKKLMAATESITSKVEKQLNHTMVNTRPI